MNLRLSTLASTCLGMVCLTICSAVSSAQQPPAKDSPAADRVFGGEQGPTDGAFDRSLSSEQDSSDLRVFTPPWTDPDEIPPPPPEPATPDWGSLDAPVPRPLITPTLDYELVGPPAGIVQADDGFEYRRSVQHPDGVYVADTRFNQPIDLYRPDGFAPLGVLGDHTLQASRLLVSYRFNQTSFRSNLNGTHLVSDQEVLAAFGSSPRRMVSQRHLVVLEYAPTDDLTLLAQLPFVQTSVDHLLRSGANLRTDYTNIGDIGLQSLLVLWRGNRRQLHLNLGASIPVGIPETLHQFPVFTSPQLSYPMRPSSGTFDFLPGLTYRAQSDLWTWGSQILGDVHLGRNRFKYRLGDQVGLTTWAARRWTETIASSARLDAQIFTNIRGADKRIDPALSPLNRSNLRGGERLDLLFGLNYFLGPWQRVPGQFLSIEAGFPIYQSLDGPQPRARWLLNTGLQCAF